MPTDKTCAECGATLPESALGNRCPKCLMQLALDARDEATTIGPAEHREPPTALELLSQSGARHFGDYELFEQIARGGMGVVYKARQVRLDRIVALKMILSGQFASKQEILRFRSEAEAAANLRHPNIVAIYETGECEGQHYFSMEYVQGRNLAEIARDGPLPAHRAARYALVIAEAIHYAHQQSTLHRDLKPSNVLIDADDQPRITDFGLAKRVRGDFGLTVTGQVLGSPNFMPPEQCGFGVRRLDGPLVSEGATREGCRGDRQGLRRESGVKPPQSKVGPPSDVYGIGAILYHLLAGRPPFQAETIEDVLIQLRESEPMRPRLLNPSVPRDLETICLKCLEKEAAKRYPTAQALAEELGRFLRDEPILSRPARKVERAWRWCRRNPVVASLSTATVLLLLAVAIGSPIATFRINRGAQLLRQNLYVADMNVAQQAVEENNLGRAVELLQRHVPKPGEADLRGFEWRYLWKRCAGDQTAILHAHDDGVSCLAFSPDGRILASGGLYDDRTVKIWDVATKKLLIALPRLDHQLVWHALAISQDGKTVAVTTRRPETVLFNTATWQEVCRLENAAVPVFLPDGKTLATQFSTTRMRGFQLWDTETWRLKANFEALPIPSFVAAFSQDAQYLAVVLPRGKVGLWNLQSQSKVGEFDPTTVRISNLVFSLQGDVLAAGGSDGRVVLWDVRTLQEIDTFPAHALDVPAIAFSPDGKKLATGSNDHFVHLWDRATRKKLATYRGNLSEVIQIAFAPDGKTFASAGKDGTVRFWSSEPELEASDRPDLGVPLGFSADSQHFITEGTNREIRFSETANGKESSALQLSSKTLPLPMTMTPSISHRALSEDGQRLAVGLTNGAIQIWNLQTHQSMQILSNNVTPQRTIAFSRNGQFLAAGAWKIQEAKATGAMSVWNLETGQAKVFSIDANPSTGYAPLALSPNGQMLATGWTQNRTKLWDVNTQRELMTLAGPRGDMLSLAFSPDGKRLAGACRDNTAWLWEIPAGNKPVILRVHKMAVAHVAFSPDGKRLITGGSDGLVQLWDVACVRPVLTLRAPDQSSHFAIFSPDGNSLLLTSEARSRQSQFPEILRPGSLADIDMEIAKANQR